MVNITIPKKLEPIVEAFYADSPQTAKKLVLQAAQAIYGSEEARNPYDMLTRFRPITEEQLEDVCVFMQSIKPADTIEAIIAAQIVVSHVLGMRKLASSFPDDQRLGLKMLRFSNDSMSRLQKKRHGAVQNIHVHYHGIKCETDPAIIPV